MKRTKKILTGDNFSVLACDPSLTAFGWVVLNGTDIMECGCIKTKTSGKKSRIRKGDDRMRRVSEINHVLKTVIEKYKVRYIVSELPHGSQSAVAAIALGLVNGAVQSMADFTGIGLEWYSEGDAKKALLGRANASKDEIIAAIDNLYDVPWNNTKATDEAIADAMAIYHVASIQSATIKLLKSGF